MKEHLLRMGSVAPSGPALVLLFAALLAAGGAAHLLARDAALAAPSPAPGAPPPRQVAASNPFDKAADSLEAALASGDLEAVTLPVRTFLQQRPASAEEVRRAQFLMTRYDRLVHRRDDAGQ